MSPVGEVTTPSGDDALHSRATPMPYSKGPESGENYKPPPSAMQRIPGSRRCRAFHLLVLLIRAHRTRRRRHNDFIQSP
jgi:hypothetical protein